MNYCTYVGARITDVRDPGDPFCSRVATGFLKAAIITIPSFVLPRRNGKVTSSSIYFLASSICGPVAKSAPSTLLLDLQLIISSMLTSSRERVAPHLRRHFLDTPRPPKTSLHPHYFKSTCIPQESIRTREVGIPHGVNSSSRRHTSMASIVVAPTGPRKNFIFSSQIIHPALSFQPGVS